MSIRVIAGEKKGHRLAVPKVRGVRPTSDRARETLFNVLAPRVGGARVLDVFAGTGAVGIEALSRGAKRTTFVERNRRAAVVIEANLEACGIAEKASVLAADWKAAMRRLGRAGERFDLVFFDPPYDWREAHMCLELLSSEGLLAPYGIVVIEHRSTSPPSDVEGWERQRQIDVGDTSFSIFSAAC